MLVKDLLYNVVKIYCNTINFCSLSWLINNSKCWKISCGLRKSSIKFICEVSGNVFSFICSTRNVVNFVQFIHYFLATLTSQLQ